MAAAMMIIHESARIAVHYEASAGDRIVIVFATAETAAGATGLHAASLSRKAGVATIAVIAKTPCPPSVEDPDTAAIASIRAVTGTYRSVVACGEGAAGFTALLHAQALGADAALAFGPRLPDGWTPDATRIGRDAYAFFDPRDGADAAAVGALRASGCNLTAIPMAFSAGSPVTRWAGTPALVALFAACTSRDIAGLQRICSELRRRSPARAPAIAAAAQARHPRIAASIVENHLGMFQRNSGAAAAEPPPPAPAAGFCPTVTVFGSCRVYNPCALLAADGRIRLHQSNIFGFVHCAAEVLQQFRLISGETVPPGRLRPYLNIRSDWQQPAPGPDATLAARFAATDVFVVEVSSVRLLRFKAFLLQINRTREILTSDTDTAKDWWTTLTRTGVNTFESLPQTDRPPTEAEIMANVTLEEQPVAAIRRDVEAIARRLGKPVLFVSHLNTDMTGKPIAQRTAIIAAMREARIATPSAILDPTALVRAAGISNAMADGAHYQPAFERQLADVFHNRLAELLPSPHGNPAKFAGSAAVNGHPQL